MAMPWSEFLADLQGRHGSLLAFAYDWWLYNAPLVERIQQAVPPPAKILEVGAATGAISVILAARGYDVVGIDIDETVLDGARKFAEHFRMPCRFEVADGFDLGGYAGQFDLAFSAGVLEHFPEEQAVRMLREKAKAATRALAIVPTTFALRNDPFTEASDARPMTIPKLTRQFRLAGIAVEKRFGYGVPDDWFSGIYRSLLPGVVQLVLQNRLSYACTVGCVGVSRHES